MSDKLTVEKERHGEATGATIEAVIAAERQRCINRVLTGTRQPGWCSPAPPPSTEQRPGPDGRFLEALSFAGIAESSVSNQAIQNELRFLDEQKRHRFHQSLLRAEFIGAG